MLGFILINIRNRGLKQPESRMTTGQYDVYFASRAQVVSRSPYHLVRSFRIGANGASIAPAPPAAAVTGNERKNVAGAPPVPRRGLHALSAHFLMTVVLKNR